MKKIFLFVLLAKSLFGQTLTNSFSATDSAIIQARKMISGKVWYVGSSTTLTTIAAGITAASSGDVVIVFPGTYSTALTLKDGVTVKGMDKERVVISGAITVATATTCKLSDVTTNGNITVNGSGFLSVDNCQIGNTNNANTFTLNNTSTCDIRQSDVKIGYITINNASYFNAEIGKMDCWYFYAYDTSTVNLKFRTYTSGAGGGRYGLVIGKFNPRRPDTNTTSFNTAWATFNDGHRVKAMIVGDSTDINCGTWIINDSCDVTIEIKNLDQHNLTVDNGGKLLVKNTHWTKYLNAYEGSFLTIINSRGYYDSDAGYLGSHNIETAPYALGVAETYKGQTSSVVTPAHFLQGICEVTLKIYNSTLDFTGTRGKYIYDWGMPLALACPTNIDMMNTTVIRGFQSKTGYSQLFKFAYYTRGRMDNCTFIQEMNDPNNRVYGLVVEGIDTAYTHHADFMNVRMTNNTFRNCAVGFQLYGQSETFSRNVYTKDTLIFNNIFFEYDSLSQNNRQQRITSAGFYSYSQAGVDSFFNNDTKTLKLNSNP